MFDFLKRLISMRQNAHGLETFRWTMQMATEVQATNPHALNKLIRCLLRPEMYAGLRGVMEARPHCAPIPPALSIFSMKGAEGLAESMRPCTACVSASKLPTKPSTWRAT